MARLYLDPGHGGYDPGAIANGLKEKDLTLKISLRIRDILLSQYEGITIKMSRSGDSFPSLQARTNEANNWKADLFLSVHINSGGGTGFESFIHPITGSTTKNYQTYIHEEIMKKIDMRDRGKKTANFHVLRETNDEAVLTENGFIDTTADANKMKSSAWLEDVAMGHALGVARCFNLKKKSGVKPIPSSGTLYKVQVGAFGYVKNAQNLVNELKQDGFDAYYFSENGLFKVQSGAFGVYENAKNLVNRLKAKGYKGAWITQ